MIAFKKYYKTFIWLLIMFYLLFSPSGSLPKTGLINIPHVDKIIHWGMFGIFALIFLFDSENANKSRNKTILWLFSISIIFGISSEFIQYSLIPGRNGNVIDFLADITGIICGMVFYYVFGRKILSRFLIANPTD